MSQAIEGERVVVTTPKTRMAAADRVRRLPNSPIKSHGEFSHFVSSQINAELRDSTIETWYQNQRPAPEPVDLRPPRLARTTESTFDVTDLNPNHLAGRARILHVNGTGPISVKTPSNRAEIVL